MKAVYCKCRNTYSIKCSKDKKNKNCKVPYYWEQGIGSIYKEDTEDN